MLVRCSRGAFLALAAVAASSPLVSADVELTDIPQLEVATLFDRPNATIRRLKDVVIHASLCGISKRSLQDDYVRRHCLRQCRIEDDGVVRPTFAEYERFCKETAGMDDWDAPCSDYLCCTFGCAVYGGDRSVCESIAPALRRNWLTETIADLMSSGMSQEQRCEMQKCNAYCARRAFDTCRETMFRQACEASNPHLYGCDVECSSADGKRPMAIASFVGLWWLAGRI